MTEYPLHATKTEASQLRAALAERFVLDALGGIAGHPIAALVVLILLLDHVETGTVFMWAGGVLAATVVRGLYGMRARNGLAWPLEARRLAFLGALLAALPWGVGGILFGLELPPTYLGVFLVILSGLVATATATLVADRPAFYGFSTILMGSIIVSVGIRGFGLVNPIDPEIGFGFAALILIFWVLMSELHRKNHRHLAEQLETRNALRATQDQYQGLVESAHDLVWQVDLEGRWTYLNAAANRIYGAPPERLLGEVALDRAESEHLQADIAAFGRVLRGSDLVDHETVHRTTAGEARNLSFSARPLRDSSGSIRGAQGMARDVTSQVEAREALEEVARKNSLVRSLINGTEDLIYFKDGDGVYQGCNWRFADHLGRSEEDIVGRTDAELVDPARAAAYRASDMEALTSWEPVRFEEWVVDPEGRRRLHETVKTVFRHAEGDHLGLLGVTRDVTERKEAEERMRELAERAERATRMKSAFLANMSHEIRTPMNGVLGMTEILLGTSVSPEQRQYLEIIQSSGESLLGVLNDILDISKIEAGHMELEEVTFDLHKQIQGAVALFTLTAHEKGSELILDIRPEVPRGVIGDPTRLRQVLSNLIGNAVKFTQEGEILVSASWEGGDLDRARVRFSVRDTGVGIPEDKLQSIFQEFTQADSSTTREYGGTGLGLTISRHLVSLMKGDLKVDSQEGEGSEFHFTLTLPIAEDFRPDEPSEQDLDFSGLRALIVDDVETNRRIFRDFLEGAGAAVQTTAGAVEALRLLTTVQPQQPFDIVILDLLMPGRDGLQLAEDIRLDPELRDIPLMILTSSNRPGDRRLARRLRVEGFLQKPVSRAELLKGLKGILKEKQPREAVPASRTDPPISSQDREEPVPEDLGVTVGLDVLVAEDNLVNQKVALGLLSRWGCKVRLAENGLEVLRALEEKIPALILMDVQMPEMDGLEATRRIRMDERFSSVPILALTAHVLPEERQMFEQAGMDDYVPKPFKPEELRSQVEYWAVHHRGSPLVASGDGVSQGATASGVGGGGGADVEEPLVDLEGFRAAMRDAGIESVVDEAVAAYLLEIPGRMATLERAVADEDLGAVEHEAHTMKSSARNIRAESLGNLLQTMESAAREGNLSAAKETLPRLRKTLDDVLDFLQG